MTLLISSIIISLILVFAIYAGIKGYEKTKRIRHRKGTYAFSLFGFVGMIILLFGTFTEVGANQVGIIYDELKGGIQDETYHEGLHAKSIFEHITEISTANRTASITTTGQTNDGQYATFELSIIYKINSQDAGKFYRVANTTDIPSEALNTIVKSSLQSSTINYNIFYLLSTGLETARIDFKEDLASSLYEIYYVTLVDVSFDDVDAGADVEAILQEKAEAEQKIKISELNANANFITAENEAKIKKTLADAEAYAIKAQGEANGDAANAYTKKVTEMIDEMYENMQGTMSYAECSDLVLSIVFYDTWDGVLPEVLTSDALSSMIGSLISK